MNGPFPRARGGCSRAGILGPMSGGVQILGARGGNGDLCCRLPLFYPPKRPRTVAQVLPTSLHLHREVWRCFFLCVGLNIHNHTQTHVPLRRLCSAAFVAGFIVLTNF